MALSRVERQRQFVQSLAAADAAAIGFGVDVNVATIPRALLAEAEAVGLPVFRVPFETTFGMIVQHVMERVLRGTGPQVASLISMQERLISTLDRPDAEQALLEQLRALLGAEGGIVAGGEVVTSLGSPPWPDLLEQIEAGHGYRAGQGRLDVCVPVDAPSSSGRYLAVTIPRDKRAEGYARPVVRFAGVVLQLAATGRRLAAREEQALRAALLDDLLDELVPSSQLLERVKSFGFDPAQAVRCAVIRSARSHRDAAAEIDEALAHRAVNALEWHFAERQIVALMRYDRHELIAMWQGASTGGGLMDALGAIPGMEGCVVGIGPTACLHGRSGLQRSVNGARAAALQVGADEGEERLGAFEELGYCEMLLASVPVDDYRAAPSPIEVLRHERSELLTTLVSYFEHDLDVVACAATLNLHPNSLRYRLSRVEELLGRSLKSPALIADVFVALRSERVQGALPERAVPAAARQAARARAPLAAS